MVLLDFAFWYRCGVVVRTRRASWHLGIVHLPVDDCYGSTSCRSVFLSTPTYRAVEAHRVLRKAKTSDPTPQEQASLFKMHGGNIPPFADSSTRNHRSQQLAPSRMVQARHAPFGLDTFVVPGNVEPYVHRNRHGGVRAPRARERRTVHHARIPPTRPHHSRPAGPASKSSRGRP